MCVKLPEILPIKILSNFLETQEEDDLSPLVIYVHEIEGYALKGKYFGFNSAKAARFHHFIFTTCSKYAGMKNNPGLVTCMVFEFGFFRFEKIGVKLVEILGLQV